MAEPGVAPTEKSGVAPVPVSAAICGLPAALSFIETEALRVPAAEGAKVMLSVQFAPAATLEPQVLVWAKSPAFAPVSEIPATVSTEPPLFVSVMVWAALVEPIPCDENVRLAGASVTAATTPLPVKATVCGLPAALSVMDADAERAPVVDGSKVTLIVQNAPEATGEPQVFVWLKSEAFAPVRLTLLMLSGTPPVFVTVMFCPVLVVPTACDPKEIPPEGARLTAGTAPAPLNEIACSPPAELSEMATEAVRALAAVGANETLIVQFALAASETGQLFDSLKSPGSAPVSEML